jgi:chromosome segregation ATPase
VDDIKLILGIITSCFALAVTVFTFWYRVVVIPNKNAIDSKIDLHKSTTTDKLRKLEADQEKSEKIILDIKEKMIDYKNQAEYTKGKLESLPILQEEIKGMRDTVIVTENRVDSLEVVISKVSDKIDVILRKFDDVSKEMKGIGENVATLKGRAND